MSAFCFVVELVPSADNIGNVVCFDWVPLLVKAVAVVFHVVHPDLVSSAGICFCKNEDTGLNSRLWIEDSARHKDYALQLLILNKFFAEFCVGFVVRVVQNSNRNDAHAASANF